MSYTNLFEEQTKFKHRLVGYESSVSGDSSDGSVSDSQEKPTTFPKKHSGDSLKAFKNKEFQHSIFEQSKNIGSNSLEQGKRCREHKDDTLVFGYASKLFRQADLGGGLVFSENTAKIDSDSWFNPKNSHSVVNLDRFDVRNLLEDPSSYSSIDTKGSPKANPLDSLRYQDLDSEEEIIFDMESEERDAYVEEKRKRRSFLQDWKGAGFDFKYDEVTLKEEATEPLEFSFPIPEGMPAPKTRKQLSIIEKTARFIVNSANPLIELKIQARQATNYLFKFLNRDDLLHPFFEKVKTLIKLGLYSYCISESEQDSHSSPPPPPPPSSSTPKPVSNEPLLVSAPSLPSSQEDKWLIELLAKAVAQSGPTLEQRVRVEQVGDSRFLFLLPWNSLYNYYTWRLTKEHESKASSSVTLPFILPSDDMEKNYWIQLLVQTIKVQGPEFVRKIMLLCRNHPKLTFILPWDKDHEYYCWKLQQFTSLSLDEICDVMPVVASEAVIQGSDFEKQLALDQVNNPRFAFLLPWEKDLNCTYRKIYTDIKNAKPLVSEPISTLSTDKKEIIDRFARAIAHYGTELEHSLRMLFGNTEKYNFLVPWGSGHDDYLDLLAGYLIDSSLYSNPLLPPDHDRVFIDHIASAVAYSKGEGNLLALLISLNNPKLSFLTPGDTFHPYYVQRLASFRSNSKLPTVTDLPKPTFIPVLKPTPQEQEAIDVLVDLLPTKDAYFEHELCEYQLDNPAFSFLFPGTSNYDNFRNSITPKMVNIVAKSRPESTKVKNSNRIKCLWAWLQVHYPDKFPEKIGDLKELAAFSVAGTQDPLASILFPLDQNVKTTLDTLVELTALSPDVQLTLSDLDPSTELLNPDHLYHDYYKWRKHQKVVLTASNPRVFISDFVFRHGLKLQNHLNQYPEYGFAEGDLVPKDLCYTPKVSLDFKRNEDIFESPFLDQVAKLVLKNGLEFEKQLLLDQPTLLPFLNPSHPHYHIYQEHIYNLQHNTMCDDEPCSPEELTEVQKMRLARVKKLLSSKVPA